MKKKKEFALKSAFRGWLIGLCVVLLSSASYAQILQHGGAILEAAPCLRDPCGPELVVNGDFENGNTGFDSDYDPTLAPCCCATYAVIPDAFAFHPNHWFTSDDHTFGSNNINDTQGLFFAGDADCELNPADNVTRPWFQQINVVTGVTYAFEAWISNLNNNNTETITTNRAIFTITAGNQPLLAQSFIINSVGTGNNGRWTRICGEYTSTITGTIEISINVVPEVSTLVGADFGIDDISFRAISPGDPGFTVTRKTGCANDLVLFTANTAAGIHNWQFPGGIPGNSNNAVAQTVFSTPGTYTVTHTLSLPNSNCVRTESVQIVVKNCPPPNDCASNECGNNLVVNGDFENGNTGFNSGLASTIAFGLCGGRYKIDNSAVTYSGTDSKGSTWTANADHTAAGTQFMIGDPPCTSDGVVVWEQNVNTAPATTYNFSAWLYNLCEDANQPTVALKVNGNVIYGFTPLPTTGSGPSTTGWTKICGTYVSNLGGSVLLEIEIGPSTDATIAADFGLDDISFRRVGNVDATFNTTPTGNCAGSPVSFSTPGSTGVVTHNWDFGDPSSGASNTSTDPNPTHTYNLSGTYTITHTVTEVATGCQETYTQKITIDNCCSVTSAFTYTPSQDLSECEISFTDQSTFSTQTGSIDSWSWTMYDQDGTVTTYSVQNPVHEFNGPGPHTVCLTVTGSTGGETCISEYCEEFRSPCRLTQCDATFVMSPERCAGSTITFTSASNNSVIHSWDFGDGNTSTNPNPTHTYNTAGQYTITHYVTDPITACEAVYTEEIIIFNCCRITAAFAYTPGADPSECEITFADQSQPDPGTTITDWLWTMTDKNGMITTYPVPDPVHQFNGPGPHTVCLEVTGMTGGESCTSVICQEVTSPCVPCNIDACFTWNVVGSTTGLGGTGTKTLHFEDCSTVSNAQDAIYKWTFIDVLTGSVTYEIGQDNPDDHTFTTMSASGQSGGGAIVCLSITNPEPIYPTDPECVSDCYCLHINLITLEEEEIPCQDDLGGRKGNSDGNAALVNLDGNTVSVFPNPFSTTVNVLVKMEEAGMLAIDMIDITGKIVYNFTNKNLDKGDHRFSWNPQPENADGLYILRIRSKDNLSYQKINLIR